MGLEVKNNRVCRGCLLEYEAERDAREIGRYFDAIKEADRVDEATALRRLDVCRGCEKLNHATCEACGCYVEFRAQLKDGRCPKRKW